MNINKRGAVVLSLIFSLLLLASCRGTDSTGGGSDQPFADALRPLFFRLPNILATNADDTGVIYGRFILFIAALALFHFGIKKIPGMSEGKSGVALAVTMALISTIAIPQSFIISIITTYSYMMALLFALVPIIAGMYIANAIDQTASMKNAYGRVIKAVIFFLLAYVTQMFIFAIDQLGNSKMKIMGDWAMWAVIILVVAGIFNLLGAFGGGATSAAEGIHTARESIRGGGGGSPKDEAAMKAAEAQERKDEKKIAAQNAAQQKLLEEELKTANSINTNL
jgi:hypothetical protein